MGANYFTVTGQPGDMEESFQAEADSSRYMSGHSYSGEIGMKDDVVRVTDIVFASLDEALGYAALNTDPRVDDKWGPAGAIQYRHGDQVRWLFFGWASS